MKNFKRIVVMVIAVAMLAALFAGCTTAPEESASAEEPSQEASSEAMDTEEASTEAAAEGEPYTIGFVVMNTTMTWMQYAIAGAQEAADEAGVEMQLYDSENDVAKQTANIEDAIAAGVDGIVTNPLNVESLTPALIAAAEAGVPVVTFDRRAEGAQTVAHVGSDDVASGELAAEYIGEQLGGQGTVIELVGQTGASPTIDRGNGFHSVLEEKYPDIEVVYSQTGEFMREQGMAVMEDAITTIGEFDAVFAHNDDMMMGALQAMNEAGYNQDEIVTISIDGIPDALRALEDGTLDATIQFPVALGRVAVETLIEYLENGSVENDAIVIDSWLITKDNVETGDFYPELLK